MASTRVQIRLCHAVDTPLVAWTGLPCGSAAAVWAGHRKGRGRSALPRPLLPWGVWPPPVRGYAKLPVPLRGGASGGLPSFFKGVQRDQFVLIRVRRIPFLGAVASQCLLISWGSTFAGAFRVVVSLPAIPARYRAHVGFIHQLGSIVNACRDQAEEFLPFWQEGFHCVPSKNRPRSSASSCHNSAPDCVPGLYGSWCGIF